MDFRTIFSEKKTKLYSDFHGSSNAVIDQKFSSIPSPVDGDKWSPNYYHSFSPDYLLMEQKLSGYTLHPMRRARTLLVFTQVMSFEIVAVHDFEVTNWFVF